MRRPNPMRQGLERIRRTLGTKVRTENVNGVMLTELHAVLFRLVIKGYTYNEIARHLTMPVTRVAYHVGRLSQRLDTEGVAGAAKARLVRWLSGTKL